MFASEGTLKAESVNTAGQRCSKRNYDARERMKSFGYLTKTSSFRKIKPQKSEKYGKVIK